MKKLTNNELAIAIDAVNQLQSAPPGSKPNALKFKLVAIGRVLNEAIAPYNERRMEIIRQYAPDGANHISPDDDNYQQALAEINELLALDVTIQLPVKLRQKDLETVDAGILTEQIIAGLLPLIE